MLLEPINQRDRPGYFYSTIGEAAAIIELVGAPNLRVMFDVYHVGVSEGDVLMRLRRYLPLIGHVQLAAVPSRAEPDEGEIAYRAIFDELDRLGYDGWVGANTSRAAIRMRGCAGRQNSGYSSDPNIGAAQTDEFPFCIWQLSPIRDTGQLSSGRCTFS